MKTGTAEFFGAEWIAPRPQTDVALMLGIAHTLVDEKLLDEKFLKTYTTGFDKFLPYLMGDDRQDAEDRRMGGRDLRMCRRTRSRTLRIGSPRTARCWPRGWSLQRQQYGEQRHWMLVTLAAMLGQIGLPGGGFGFSYHYASGGAPSADAPVLTGITDGGKAKAGAAWLTESGAASIPVARVVDMLAEPRQGVRLQRRQGQVSRRQDGLLGRRQSVRPSPGPQPHGRGLEEARNLHRPGLPVDADCALRRHRAAGDDLL